MSEVKEVFTIEEFDTIISDDKPTLVDFYATWCGPCKMQAPILHEFAGEVGEKVQVIKVDVDQVGELAMRYGIMSIPTLVVFKNGELKEKSVGLSTKDNLASMIIKYL